MSARIASPVADVARRALSVGDLARMIDAGIIEESEGVELCEGELVVMAAKRFAHEAMKAAIVRHLNRRCSDEMFVGVETSLKLDDQTLLEPDILVCRRDRIATSLEGYLALQRADVLLVVEVADTTLHRDRTSKARLYARFGIADYWIVDVNARRIWTFRQPRDGVFLVQETVAADQLVTPTSGDIAECAVRLDDLAISSG